MDVGLGTPRQTFTVIFFTVFIQGSTIKLVVAKLNIQTKSTEVFNYHILQMITLTAVTTFKLNKTSNIIQTKAMKGNETVISKVQIRDNLRKARNLVSSTCSMK